MTEISKSPVSNVSAIKERLLHAGEGNQKLSDVDGYVPGMLSLEDNLDEILKLKLLHLAAWGGDVPTIEHLKGIADGTVTTAGGFTPLHLAASRGHTQALRLLLEWPDVDIEACSLEGFTALHLAAYGGHYECTEALLRKHPTSAHLNARDKVTGRTPLHWAVCSDSSSLKVFHLLLQIQMVDVSNGRCMQNDRAGFTPLHLATMNVNFHEMVLEADRKEALLKVIQNPKVLDETPEPWIQSIFQNETKKLVLEEIQKSEFADRTPRDLIQAILEDISEKMVKTLLKRFSGQVNDKVGNVGWFLSMPDVKDFDSRSWRKLRGIATVHPKRNLQSFMSGYTALHFAASQDNAELVSYLLTFPEIKVNEPDMIYGMTPLHCSLRRGSTKAFAVLTSFKDVDVNAQLVQGGEGDSTDPSLAFLKEFQSLETPLHLAIRFCPSEALLQAITRFCSSPSLNLCICNNGGVFPLQLGWRRSIATAPISTSRIKGLFSFLTGCLVMSRSVATASARHKIFTSEEKFTNLQGALDLLEQHPQSGFLMETIRYQSNAVQAITNAVLVAATLLFGVTFQASIQPPNTAGDDNWDVSLLFFYSCNTSFVYAGGTIFYCLGKYFTRPSIKSHRVFPFKDTDLASEQIRGVFLLSVALICGFAAYLVSDYANKAALHFPQGRNLGYNGFYFVLLSFCALYTLFIVGDCLKKTGYNIQI